MALQTGKNVVIAYSRETTFNTPPAATGANVFRPNAGPGLSLARALINSNEIRSDLKTSMARLGSRSVSGSYTGDLSVGTFDPLFEAGLRGTWVPAVVATNTQMTSVTTGANSIVATSGSWITQGIQVGDVIQATGLTDASNNGRDIRITGVTATTLTTADALIPNATPDTSFSITRGKKLIQPAVPVRRSFTFEEYDADIDLSVQYTGVRVSSIRMTGAPDAMATVEFGLVGSNMIPLTTGTSPYFTGLTPTNSIGLVMTDAVLRMGGADIVTLTAFDMTLDTRAATQPVIGSTFSPDVFDNSATVAGSLSAIRGDFTNLNRFINETEFDFYALLQEPGTANYIEFYIPRCKLTGVTKGFGQDGAMIETLPFVAGDEGAGIAGHDDTMLSITTSAA